MLGVALGFGVLAGLNLYLTVFVTGLAIKLEWLILAEKYSDLQVLENPWILGISGTMFLIETFADKIPWVDSAWDVLHTAIRPVGGVMLALGALGELDTSAGVIAALLCGGTALVSHTAKAGTRAVANLSPEPVSNIVLSTTEDAVVLGGLSLMAFSPEIAFFVFLGLLLIAALISWKTSKFITKAWKKLRNRRQDAAA